MSNVFYNAFGDFFSGNKKSIETFSNSEITKCDDYTNEEDKVICQKGYDGGADGCKDVYYAAKPVCNKGVALKEAFENSQKETTGTANTSSTGLGSLPKNKDQDFLALDGNLVLDGVVKATGFLKKDGTPLTEVPVLKENYVMPKDIKYTAGGNLEFKSAKTESVTTNNLRVNSFIKGNLPDTRNENKNPDEYRKMVGKGKIQEFKTASKVDVSAGGYGILTTTVPWPDTSGGKVFQRFEKDNGDKITVWERTEKDKTSWNSWKESGTSSDSMKTKSLTVDDDLQFTGKNNWILHTPDDNRRTLYVAPSKTAGKTDWDWANQTKFNADGSIEMKKLSANHVRSEKTEVVGPLHFYDKTTKGDDSDAYRIEKIRHSGNNNELRVMLHDDTNESMTIYGNSCRGGKCGDDSKAKVAHKFSVSGDAHHSNEVYLKNRVRFLNKDSGKEESVIYSDGNTMNLYRASGGNIVEVRNDRLKVNKNLETVAEVTHTGGNVNHIKNPNGHTKINKYGIMFGGNNNGKETNSAQISAGIHRPNSLNIVGMSSGKSHTDRKVEVWAEGGMKVNGHINTNKLCIGSVCLEEKGGRLEINKPVTIHSNVDNGLVLKSTHGGRPWNYIEFRNKDNSRYAWSGAQANQDSFKFGK